MTTAQEKLVVRVSLGAAAATSEDLPQVLTEQQWHWRRIAGAALTLVAAALLLYGWLNVELPEAQPAVEIAPVLADNTEAFDADTPELVLEAVPQDQAPEPEVANTRVIVANELEPAVVKPSQVIAVAVETPAQQPVNTAKVAASQHQPDAVPLFKADVGVLRLALLTSETPSAKARSLGDHIDAAAIPQLALYSEVKGLNGQSIEHLWYYEGKLMTRIKLPVKLDYWRTYSRKEFDASQKGEWRVEILDPQQNLLFSHHFHYQ